MFLLVRTIHAGCKAKDGSLCLPKAKLDLPWSTLNCAVPSCCCWPCMLGAALPPHPEPEPHCSHMLNVFKLRVCAAEIFWGGQSAHALEP